MSEHYKHKIIKIRDLVKYDNNPRTHSDNQISQLVGSIQEFGFTNPVLIDNKNNIIAGHGRSEAANLAGLDEVPCIVLDGLSEEQKKAIVIADNQLALNAGWDLDLLKGEVLDLGENEFDLDLLGFDGGFLDDLLSDEDELELIEDEAPEAQEDPISKTGDVWLCGNHRVMCGDSTSIDDVEKLMAGEKASLVFTDPPYGVSYRSNYRSNMRKDKFDILKNDDVFLDICPIIEMFSDGWVFVWTAWKVLVKWIEMFEGFGYPTNIIIWNKGGGGMGDLEGTFSSDYEVAMVWNRGAKITGKRIGSVWSIGKDSSISYEHPTQKPVSLAAEAIDKTSNRNDVVLDLFGGSGSTMIACEQTSRKARIMELDPRYADVIVKRWEKLTEEFATLESSGERFNEL